METLTSQHFRFAGFELDRTKRLLLKDGEPVPLNPKAFDILLALVESRGDVLTKDLLLEKIWPDQIVEEGNLTVQVSAIRKALGQRGQEHRFIVTVPGRGYSFVADLEGDSRDEIIVERRRYSEIVVEDEDPLLLAGNVARPRSPVYVAVAALSVIALAAVGFASWYLTRTPRSSESIESIAVMPFVNESGNSDLEYLSDGMTDSLINSLSKLQGVSVKARSIVFRYKGKDVLPTDVGSDLNVQAILIGRVVERGDQLTLYLSLVDASSGDQLWGDQYNRRMTEVLSLQNEIVRDVSRKLSSKLSGADEEKLAKNFPENAEAFQLYLKGRYFWNKFTPPDHAKATEFFSQAIAKDPDYALAYVGLADTYGASAVNSWLTPREAFPKAKAAVRKALEIDSDLADAHATLGAMYLFSDFDWNGAEQEFKRAIELNANHEIAHQLYSYLLTGLRRHDEAIAEAQRARDSDPLSATFSDDLALAYNMARRYDDAIKQNLKTLEIEPDRPDPIYRLGTMYEQKGMHEEAIAAFQKAISLSERTSNYLGSLGHAYAASGRRDQAEEIRNELEAMSKQGYVSPYDLAIIDIGLGEKEKAEEQLERAFAEQSGWIVYLRVDPYLDPLRDDPRFQALIARSRL